MSNADNTRLAELAKANMPVTPTANATWARDGDVPPRTQGIPTMAAVANHKTSGDISRMSRARCRRRMAEFVRATDHNRTSDHPMYIRETHDRDRTTRARESTIVIPYATMIEPVAACM